jgi:hypothetical protein
VRRIGVAYRDNVFVNVIRVDVVQVAVMKIVKMALMADRCMPAVRAMLVRMVGMPRRITGSGSLQKVKASAQTG